MTDRTPDLGGLLDPYACALCMALCQPLGTYEVYESWLGAPPARMLRPALRWRRRAE
jgi:hypothetical protein